LKPGEETEPIIAETDKALETGSVEYLVKKVSDAIFQNLIKSSLHLLD